MKRETPENIAVVIKAEDVFLGVDLLLVTIGNHPPAGPLVVRRALRPTIIQGPLRLFVGRRWSQRGFDDGAIEGTSPI
jgi:hypothetical protein